MGTDSSTIVRKTTRAGFGRKVLTFFIYVAEVLLPPLLGAAGVAWLFTQYNVWGIGQLAGSVLYVLAAVLLAFMLVVVLDMVTTGARKVRGSFGRGALARLIKFALGGLVLPLALSISALAVQMPGGKNLLTTVMGAAKAVVVASPARETAEVVRGAAQVDVQRSGIELLGNMRNKDGLEQLIVLLNEEPRLLRDGGTRQALVQALAGYGPEAKDVLLSVFSSVPPAEAGAVPSDDLYGRYLAAGFEGISKELRAVNPAALAEAEALRNQTEASLHKLTQGAGPSRAGDLRPLVVLQTFQAMEITSDGDILSLALRTAAEGAYPPEVRGEALLLVGKLGKTDNLKQVYSLSADPDALVQVRALQAASAILLRER